MPHSILSHQLVELGILEQDAKQIADKLNGWLNEYPPEMVWEKTSQEILSSTYDFSVHLFLFSSIYPDWPAQLDSAPAWLPEEESIKKTHLGQMMQKHSLKNIADFHQWSVNHVEEFWKETIDNLGIIFQIQPKKICDLTDGIESPRWLKDAKFNIAESCLSAPKEKTAIIFQNHKGKIEKYSYEQLNCLSNRIANSLEKNGFKMGDAIAIDMPMTALAVAIYLGIIKMGGIVVSIADSFSKEEIETRLKIANTKAIFTQDVILRDSKKLPLYEKVVAANAPPAIVIPALEKLEFSLRAGDSDWKNFLVENENYQAQPCEPMSHCNILFSSGTTGTPKAIPWNHITPIKSASDAYYHHDIQPHDILAWPTNLGWMMGPWLIFAALINKATIALYDGVPRDNAFGKFIQDAKVTVLGVVPTLVANWRQTRCMENLDWSHIKAFSSTGECSNPEDMLYLMSLAGYKPVIEYCGGTEIGGSYITSSLIEKNYPSVFTTPAAGLQFILIDENGESTDNGEVALIPPSIGLSTELLNADHHKIYFANMPLSPAGKILRRHGDQVRRLENGNYCILGRIDDTMNLGGIKVSSAEIERVLSGIENIMETAAVAQTPASGYGPSQLVIYAATPETLNKNPVMQLMQQRINQQLNPLFKISDVIFLKELPKTASNKIMRRKLRDEIWRKST